ncbi:TOPRIM nucleotidyl transferase/hydrolase domain-containing protein [Streptomyces sp. NBC_00102]|uniref:TOPRIM nucleotidyl transferase/hydrolase domain-containing protein n=1 Tax=Streptomyces sp. NBC_00102 TaxID=2975652 RepID=UPI002253C7FA|nr:TOPRIM nucleotidyl transferase/hydrolase domain-containing protein [Streptomyces sp. NBC_00102]MCX5396704.1 ATP-dependent endonuclease [Streptomyces sp. NBC_00102]
MDETNRFREAVAEWAADGASAVGAAGVARELAGGVRTVVLVEGASDLIALETLAARDGRDLGAEGVVVVPLGGATNIGRYLDVCGPPGLDLALAGLCDIGEERHFTRHLERVGAASGLTRTGLEALGFQVCSADLEDELIRALGAEGVREVIGLLGETRPFQTFQGQPAQRERPVEHQLRRFMGTHSGRKALYARALVAHLDHDRVPRPLEHLLARV